MIVIMSRKPKRPRAKQPEQRAKVFWTGRSQAVRLPKEFRFEDSSVRIRRHGRLVILEPDDGWPDGFFEWLRSGPHLPEDFELPPDPPAEPFEL